MARPQVYTDLVSYDSGVAAVKSLRQDVSTSQIKEVERLHMLMIVNICSSIHMPADLH